jgi:hypothetical protein
MTPEVEAVGAVSPSSVASRAYLARWSDRVMVWSVIGLAAVMPYAHTGRIQSALLAGAIVGWLSLWYADPNWRWVKTPVNVPLLVFVSWSMVALVTALDVAYSAREIKNELVANGVLFVLAASAVRREGGIDAPAWAMSLAGLVMSVQGVLEYGWTLDLVVSRGMRTSSFTSDPIFFSSYLVLAIPVAFYLAMASTRPVARWAAWGIWGVEVLALVSNATRAAWLAVALQFLVYGLLKSRRVLVIWIIVLAASAGVVATQPAVRQALVTKGWFDDYGRTLFWENLLPRLANSPISGFGYGQETPERAAPGVRKATPFIDSTHAFNSFIETALELGLIGLALFCWVLWRVALTLWRGFRNAPTHSTDSAWLVCMLMVFAGFVLRNQVDHLFRDAPGHLFWILMGLGVGRAVARPSDSAS